MIALGYRAEEVQYPLGKGRYRPGDALPWLLICAIPRLSEEPDALYDELIAFAARRPAAPMREHYLALFGWLADRLRRPLWIERSGASIEYLGSLVELYPAARFVHIHRDGLEAALSIQAHPYFRAGIALVYGLLGPGTDLRENLRRAAETPPPLWAVGRFWSEQVLRGVSALPRLDRSQYLMVRFEDLIAKPREVLREIAGFFELPPSDGFLDRASALVGEAPPPRFPALSPAEREELSAACRPGQLALGRAS
jgi:sulfotransferase family protein